MYGALNSTLRSGETRKVNFPVCGGPPACATSPRPASSGADGATPGPSWGTPVLVNCCPPRSGPLWHDEHAAFPKKSNAPRLASAESALSSRARYRSNGEPVLVNVAISNAAMAFAACSNPSCPVETFGYAALNFCTYADTARTRPIVAFQIDATAESGMPASSL